MFPWIWSLSSDNTKPKDFGIIEKKKKKYWCNLTMWRWNWKKLVFQLNCPSLPCFTIVSTKNKVNRGDLRDCCYLQIISGKWLTFEQWSRKPYVWKDYKLSLSRNFKEDTKGSSISMNFQTGVRFSSWSTTLKLMVQVKFVDSDTSSNTGWDQLHRTNTFGNGMNPILLTLCK